jgi:hypothetical protein
MALRFLVIRPLKMVWPGGAAIVAGSANRVFRMPDSMILLDIVRNSLRFFHLGIFLPRLLREKFADDLSFFILIVLCRPSFQCVVK